MKRNGTRTVDGVSYQRYLCRPSNGDAAHTLKSFVSGGGVAEPVAYSPPERCPTHFSSRTVRNGKTVSAHGVERQRYLCMPTNGDPPHRFTPVLSRTAVRHGDTCPECARARGVNQGDTNAARGHKYTMRVVATSLAHLGAGDSYGSVAVRAKKQMAAMSHQPVEDDARFTAKELTRKRRNAWRLSADWVEAFSPVLFEPWAAAARSQVETAMAGRSKDRPVVSLLLDDIPIFAKSKEGVKQRQRFSVLAASESFIDADNGTRVNRLRLLRAFPDHRADDYKLLLAELGYVPDLILADGGKGIGAAVRWLAKARPDKPFQVCLSAYHWRKQLLYQLSTLTTKTGFQPGNLEGRLEDWSFCSSLAVWQTWWTDYQNRLLAQNIPVTTGTKLWEQKTKPIVDAQMHVLDENRLLPRSTGRLEATLFEVVKPAMLQRAAGFGNLERTNRLLDLMTLRANGVFDDMATVSRALEADARRHGGYAAPVRSITDIRMNRSLLDETVVAALVKRAGM